MSEPFGIRCIECHLARKLENSDCAVTDVHTSENRSYYSAGVFPYREAIAAFAEKIALVKPVDGRRPILTFGESGTSESVWFEFFLAHRGHRMAVVSRYGSPPDGCYEKTGQFSTMFEGQAVYTDSLCHRPQEHTGEHSPFMQLEDASPWPTE